MLLLTPHMSRLLIQPVPLISHKLVLVSSLLHQLAMMGLPVLAVEVLRRMIVHPTTVAMTMMVLPIMTLLKPRMVHQIIMTLPTIMDRQMMITLPIMTMVSHVLLQRSLRNPLFLFMKVPVPLTRNGL